ncbi:MAG: sulfite exporter TauE/SafE family protein [Methylophilaceae bacterium]
MQSSLVLTSLIMGLAGGPHCVAMCGAACGSLSKANGSGSFWQFQLGRLIGYACLGALAASSIGLLAWLSSKTSQLHPIWTFFHVFIFCWGLVLLLFARQPIWIQHIGRNIWHRIQKMAQMRGGVFITGICWALMPCGLLYSAVIVASLSGNPLQGSLSMAAFAIGSSGSLIFGQWLWSKLKVANQIITESISMRLAGLALVILAGWAIWMDVVHQINLFCAVT